MRKAVDQDVAEDAAPVHPDVQAAGGAPAEATAEAEVPAALKGPKVPAGAGVNLPQKAGLPAEAPDQEEADPAVPAEAEDLAALKKEDAQPNKHH